MVVKKEKDPINLDKTSRKRISGTKVIFYIVKSKTITIKLYGFGEYPLFMQSLPSTMQIQHGITKGNCI